MAIILLLRKYFSRCVSSDAYLSIDKLIQEEISSLTEQQAAQKALSTLGGELKHEAKEYHSKIKKEPHKWEELTKTFKEACQSKLSKSEPALKAAGSTGMQVLGALLSILVVPLIIFACSKNARSTFFGPGTSGVESHVKNLANQLKSIK